MNRPALLLFNPSRQAIAQLAGALGSPVWDVVAVCDEAMLEPVARRLQPWIALVPSALGQRIAQASPNTEVVSLSSSGARGWPEEEVQRLRASVEQAFRVATLERRLAEALREVAKLKREAPRRISVLDGIELPAPRSTPTGPVLPYGLAKSNAVQAFEETYLTDVLRRAQGNVSEASRLAGLERCNFRRLLKRYLRRGAVRAA